MRRKEETRQKPLFFIGIRISTDVSYEINGFEAKKKACECNEGFPQASYAKEGVVICVS